MNFSANIFIIIILINCSNYIIGNLNKITVLFLLKSNTTQTCPPFHCSGTQRCLPFCCSGTQTWRPFPCSGTQTRSPFHCSGMQTWAPHFIVLSYQHGRHFIVLGHKCNMAAISLFWDANMAARQAPHSLKRTNKQLVKESDKQQKPILVPRLYNPPPIRMGPGYKGAQTSEKDWGELAFRAQAFSPRRPRMGRWHSKKPGHNIRKFKGLGMSLESQLSVCK